MQGAIAALREVREPGEVALVLNEQTPESRIAHFDHFATVVITSPLAELSRTLVELTANAGRFGRFVRKPPETFPDRAVPDRS